MRERGARERSPGHALPGRTPPFCCCSPQVGRPRAGRERTLRGGPHRPSGRAKPASQPASRRRPFYPGGSYNGGPDGESMGGTGCRARASPRARNSRGRRGRVQLPGWPQRPSTRRLPRPSRLRPSSSSCGGERESRGCKGVRGPTPSASDGSRGKDVPPGMARGRGWE